MSQNPPGDPIAPHVPTLEDAAWAVILFHSCSPWTEAKRQEWEKLTGTTEATTRNLCDTCRRAFSSEWNAVELLKEADLFIHPDNPNDEPRHCRCSQCLWRRKVRAFLGKGGA